MSEFLMPVVEDEQQAWEPLSLRMGRASLMTPLGLVEGEVLTYLDSQDTHGVATLEQLSHELRWPTHLVMMAVGALIRAGLVQGVQQGIHVIVKLRKPLIRHRP